MCSSLFPEGLECCVEQANSSAVIIRMSNACQGYDNLENLKPMIDMVAQARVIVDLTEVQQMTTVAFARLITAKRQLQKMGRQMQVRGLRQQPRTLCELLKLSPVLLAEPERLAAKESKPGDIVSESN